MVKLALCFSGDPRTYNRCFESIKINLLDKFDCDIFVSTYETTSEIKNDILNLYKPKKYNFHDRNNITKIVSEYLENFEGVKTKQTAPFDYKPVDDIVCTNNYEEYFFNYDKYENNFVYCKLCVGALCQFFGIFDVSNLCKEYMLDYNTDYDYILRLRLDDTFYSKFVLNELKENELLVNVIQYYSDSIKLHDHFFMAKPHTFFKIASLYNNIQNIIKTINNNRCWLPIGGYQETLLLIHSILQNVIIKNASFFCGKLI
jgi:hypothetical protein